MRANFESDWSRLRSLVRASLDNPPPPPMPDREKVRRLRLAVEHAIATVEDECCCRSDATPGSVAHTMGALSDHLASVLRETA